MTTTILDCSGVGAGGITRVLSELVRYWPGSEGLRVVAAPAGWAAPGDRAAEVEVVSSQEHGRAGVIAAATETLLRVTGRASGTDAQVLSMSPSLAIVGSRLPVTTIVHDLAFRLWPRDLSSSQRQYRRVSYNTAIRRSRRLICVSARTRHDLLGIYGVPYSTTSVWHPGSDLSVAPGTLPAPISAVRDRYLVVAGHAPHKGVELAVEAVAQLPAYHLVVLTGGNPVEEFRRVAAESPAAGRVLFVDRLSDAEYAATVVGAAAFLMPSHFEGYGLPAAEALRLGTPTVISPDPALLEATGGAAVRMDSWTPDAMVRALRQVESGPVPQATAELAGRSWRAATEHLVSLLADAPVSAPAR